MMIETLPKLCLCFIAALCTAEAFDYCRLNKEHTMCIYPVAVFGCPGRNTRAGLTDPQRRSLLHEHNLARQHLATGRITALYPELPQNSTQPKAANMMKLRWHRETERVAQRWTDQCKFAHDSHRSVRCFADSGVDVASCKKDDRIYAGQNGWAPYCGGYPPSAAGSPKDVVNFTRSMVVGEIVRMNDKIVDNVFVPLGPGFEGKTVLHYTQVMWAWTRFLGCGIIYKPYKERDPQTCNVLCNYVPGGNSGGPIYRRGEPCSACPKGTRCSKTYPGLCAADDDDEKDEINFDNTAHKDLVNLQLLLSMCFYCWIQ